MGLPSPQLWDGTLTTPSRKLRLSVVGFHAHCLALSSGIDVTLSSHSTNPMLKHWLTWVLIPLATTISICLCSLLHLSLVLTQSLIFTSDCGWQGTERNATGGFTWSTTTIPGGIPALVDFVHNLGLKFGFYSDG